VLIAEAGGAELDRTSLIGTANPPRRPQAEPLPASLQFSKRGERRYVLIYNKGTAALKLGAVSVDNPKDFEIDTKPCTDAPNSSSLDAEKSCPIFVTYNGRRQASGRLTVPHNDPSSPTVITLSAAGAPIEVPKLSGSKRDEALRKLRDKSLVAGTISEEPRCHDIGEVVAQSPEPRTRVPQGTAVDFTLSSMGKDPAQVPALIGQPRASAMSTLQTARLKLGQTTTSETDKFPPGSVIRTNPQAGTPLAPGCDVNLVLAVAIPKFPMPNVVGLTYASAQGRLSAFTASVQGGPVPRGEESRWVVTAQSPQEGTMLTRGTSVDITVTRPGGPSGDDVGTKPAQRPIRPGINVKQPPVNTP
jgi:serine/threonine-protein kinase